MPAERSKTSQRTFEVYFLIGVQEIWSHDNLSEFNNVFLFSVNIIELEFQPMDFFTLYFFVRKLTQTFISTLFCRNF